MSTFLPVLQPFGGGGQWRPRSGEPKGSYLSQIWRVITTTHACGIHIDVWKFLCLVIKDLKQN